MCRKLTALGCCAIDVERESPVSVEDNVTIDQQQFISDVKSKADVFSSIAQNQFALYLEKTYSFAVYLYALLHTGKKVWIAGNNQWGTAEKLLQRGCDLVGDWQGSELKLEHKRNHSFNLQPFDHFREQIVIFTSGSGGAAKEISKSMQQFQVEIEALEQQWGHRIVGSTMFATVSHQHIFGLIFKLLWPLAAKRCFYSETFVSPESLIRSARGKKACWVASPAQLKRLDELSPWSDIKQLTAVFSSGGALSNRVSAEINRFSDQKVIEIFGSSETGGIGWRQAIIDKRWQVFNKVRLIQDPQGLCFLESPYLANPEPMQLDDKIELLSQGYFNLLGRVDRIVKVEEKRISLDELENLINEINCVKQSYALLLQRNRDLMAAVVVLTEQSLQLLLDKGRYALTKALRQHLMHRVDTVAIPRKWLFMSSLPLTQHGKIDRQLIVELFSLESCWYPQLYYCDLAVDRVVLIYKVQAELEYFSGHFPGLPILPGVAQMTWAERFGKSFFKINLPFLRLEAIKFKKVIKPNQIIKMQLNWNVATGKLYFDFSTDGVSYSSGRMVYGEVQ